MSLILFMFSTVKPKGIMEEELCGSEVRRLSNFCIYQVLIEINSIYFIFYLHRLLSLVS